MISYLIHCQPRTVNLYAQIKKIIEDILNEKGGTPPSSDKSDEDEFLTVTEAARLINVKVSRIRAAIFKREIPYVKIGALVRLPKSGLLEYLEDQIKHPN